MKTRDEWMQEHDRLLGMLDEARAILKQYPGVISVEIGIKESSGDLTNDLSWRVYVAKKLPESELAPEAVIPDEVLGVKTDVIESDVPTPTFDSNKYRPLKGGIQIDNELPAGQGTLGCFAQVNGTQEIVALTNAHVVEAGGATNTIEMGQPEYTTCCCCACDDIGTVSPSDRKLDGSVDAAIVHLKSGIGITNVIRALNADGSDGVVQGSRAASVSTDTVVKVGRTSDRTTGTVVSITHSTGAGTDGTPARTDQILVKPDAGITKFQDFGDSGSVLVDKDNKVIGLMWGAYLTPGSALFGHGIACPINAVKSALDITIPEGSLQTLGAPMRTTEPVILRQQQPEASELIGLLQARLSRTEQGRALLGLIDTHKNEIIRLIQQNRAVTVTWHRKQGPAFLAALGRSAKHPAYRVPAEIEGVSRADLISSMAAALETHGSERLREAVRRYAPTVLDLLARYDSVHEIADALEDRILPKLAETYPSAD
jgi:hypothetical protein